MKNFLMLCLSVSISLLFINNNGYALNSNDYDKISIGMTYSEVISTFEQTGKFYYLVDSTGQILGNVVMKWGGGSVDIPMDPNGHRGLIRTHELGYIMIEFSDIVDNNPKSGKVVEKICCRLGDDSGCTCSDQDVYQNLKIKEPKGPIKEIGHK